MASFFISNVEIWKCENASVIAFDGEFTRRLYKIESDIDRFTTIFSHFRISTFNYLCLRAQIKLLHIICRFDGLCVRDYCYSRQGSAKKTNTLLLRGQNEAAEV